jgi:low temperature requirement protein LtrA
MPGLTRRGRIQPTGENASVTQLELFFDLILVFAFTMVTDLAAAEPTAVNMLRSLLVLAVLWWVWIDYAWLGNVVRADEGVTRVAMFVAMGGGFLAAIAIPEAFEDTCWSGWSISRCSGWPAPRTPNCGDRCCAGRSVPSPWAPHSW